MRFFTKEWHNEYCQKGISQLNNKSVKKKHKKDTAMRDYHKYLAKIEHSLPDCLRSTLHGNVITSSEFDKETLVISFDNSGGFSDVEKMFLYEANITEQECDLAGKTWLYGEFSVVGSGFALSALLSDSEDNLYYFTVHFSFVECKCTMLTDSTEAGISETLESILYISAEECGFDFAKPNWTLFIECLKAVASYKITDDNFYRFESGVYSHSCEELFELTFTRQVICKNNTYQLYICFSYPPVDDAEEISEVAVSDVFEDLNEFFNSLLETKSFEFAKNHGAPIRYEIHSEQL